MQSLKDLFIVGPGPSSSHTIGPFRICLDYIKNNLSGKDVDNITVTLLQSLALTGRGHLTDKIILQALKDYKTEVKFDISTKTEHPNTMTFLTVFADGTTDKATYISYGGGTIGRKGEKVEFRDIYPFSTFDELTKLMEEEKTTDAFDIIKKYEDPDILEFGKDTLKKMFEVIEDGLKGQGLLPGSLRLKRIAGDLFKKAEKIEFTGEKTTVLLSSFAYAVAEQNASGQLVVTSPTCGSAGVVPSALYFEYLYSKRSVEDLAKALLVGGLVGDFVKTNASVSGAVHGCQAEIGTASCMAAASLSYLNGLTCHQIEYASEVAMEHFLGLTCDPVDGYVQIPCIERNAMASLHAYSAFLFAKDISPLRHNEVFFDNVVKAMKMTGDSLSNDYKETSLGGLAGIIK